jgi:uncharacterized membrane protein HdeD (DUF308 family)
VERHFWPSAGLIGVIAGIVILIWPLSGALTLTVMLGAYAVVSGTLLLALAWRLRRLARAGTSALRFGREQRKA